VRAEVIDYRSKLHKLIPGGAHTYSRGDDVFPENAPPILSHAEGCYVWGAHGDRYLDYGMGLRSVTLGYGYERVAAAAINEIKKGNNLTRASITELAAAELLVDLIPCADMVKFAKNGSTVTTAAVKLARAYTGRKFVAICKNHPFFSYDDWFIGTTEMNRGIPEESKQLTLAFQYNDIDSLKVLFEDHPNEIACVMMEPATLEPPKNNFLQSVQKVCRDAGAVFILDELITGFRWHLQGAQTYYEVTPDLATFGKGMANGFSVAALTGKKEIMKLGGILDEGKERVFLISTTHGAEMSGLGAFLATVPVYRELNVIDHLWSYGERLIRETNSISNKLGIRNYFYLEGFPCSPSFVTKDKHGELSQMLRTLFLQEMVKKNILIPWVALSLAHGDDELELTLEAIKHSLSVYMRALNDGPENLIEGRISKPIFRRTN
jgi:glutamate-1-semialdehyde 2,1-aminomutase